MSTRLPTPFGAGLIQTGQPMLILAAPIRVTLLCSTAALSLGSLADRTVCPLQPPKPNMLLLVSVVKMCIICEKSSATSDMLKLPLHISTKMISRVSPC